jgi:hypothetical protein
MRYRGAGWKHRPDTCPTFTDVIAGRSEARSHRTPWSYADPVGPNLFAKTACQSAHMQRMYEPLRQLIRRTGFSREDVGTFARNPPSEILLSRLKPVLQGYVGLGKHLQANIESPAANDLRLPQQF